MVKTLNKHKVPILHLDVMDGHFVDEISFGAQMIKHLRPHFFGEMDVHLMVTNPLQQIPLYTSAGADTITWHFEAEQNWSQGIEMIKHANKKAGIALNPDSEIEILPEELLQEIDQILLMSVAPGKGGQKFIDYTYDKLQTLHEKRIMHHYKWRIMIDGGIQPLQYKLCKSLGADVMVVGSFLMHGELKKKLQYF